MIGHERRQLKRRGFDVGTIDGRWSERTARAANRYGVAQGMPRSPVLEVALLHALDMRHVLTGEKRARVRDTIANPFNLRSAAARPHSGSPARRTARPSVPIDDSPGALLHAGPATIAAVQHALATARLRPGAPDGNWDEAVQFALQDYQASVHLAPLGVLTPPTVAALGVDILDAQLVRGLDSAR